MAVMTDQPHVEGARPLARASMGLHVERTPRLRLSLVGSSPAHRAVLAAGLAGSALFNATFLIDGAFRPGYDTLRQPMSALSLGDGGWVQITNFIVFGVLTCFSAIGWRATLSPGAGALWYPRLKVIAGLMLIAAGIFSQDPGLEFPPGVAAPVRATLHAQIHNVAAVVSLGATIAGIFVLAWRLRREARWRTWSAYAAFTGILMMVFLAAFGANIDHGRFGGIFEKLASITALAFTIGFTGRLLTGDARLSSNLPGALEPAAGLVNTGCTVRREAARVSPWRWWLVMLVMAGALLTATGGILALHPAAEHLNSAGRNYAEYFFTRNVAMAILLLGTLAMQARRALSALMVLTALIQILDAVTATATGRIGLVPVDLVFATAFLLGATHLCGKALWRSSSWQEGTLH